MVSGCNHRFSRDGAVERRSQHGDLFRRQCSLAPDLAPHLAFTFTPDFVPGLSIVVGCDGGSSLVRQSVFLGWIPRFVGNRHFQKTFVHKQFERSSEVPRSAGIASSSRQCFGQNGAIETRLKHGYLFRRQCRLTLLAPSLAPSLSLNLAHLAPSMALDLVPDLTLGPIMRSVCRRPSAGWSYDQPHRGPGRLPWDCRSPDHGDESIGDGELWFRQASLDAAPDHVQGSRSHALDVLGQVQRLRQQGVAGHRVVRLTQLLQRERRRKTAGIPDTSSLSANSMTCTLPLPV